MGGGGGFGGLLNKDCILGYIHVYNPHISPQPPSSNALVTSLARSRILQVIIFTPRKFSITRIVRFKAQTVAKSYESRRREEIQVGKSKVVTGQCLMVSSTQHHGNTRLW